MPLACGSASSRYSRQSSCRTGFRSEGRGMMRAFEYVSAPTTKQATSLLSANWGQTEILAGGTDLLALMKEDVITPKRLVNIKEIKELAGIDLGATGLRIGALTRLVELAEHPGVRDKYPA